MKKPAKATTVDEYIAGVPKNLRAKLAELRDVIRETAPGAIERISYGMPYYSRKGRLAYFRLWKNHIGLYIPTPIIEEHRNDLSKYETTKATIRFPLDKKLPIGLIRMLVKARLKKNEARKE